MLKSSLGAQGYCLGTKLLCRRNQRWLWRLRHFSLQLSGTDCSRHGMNSKHFKSTRIAHPTHSHSFLDSVLSQSFHSFILSVPFQMCSSFLGNHIPAVCKDLTQKSTPINLYAHSRHSVKSLFLPSAYTIMTTGSPTHTLFFLLCLYRRAAFIQWNPDPLWKAMAS